MSSLYTDRIKQRDNILKQYLVVSHNYKNRYIKQRQYQLLYKKGNRNPFNKNKKSKKKAKSKNQKNNIIILSEKNNKKDEIINGGENLQNSSEFNFTKYDKSDNIDDIKYNNFSENIYKESNMMHNLKQINEKNENSFLNLKKYIDSYPKKANKDIDYLNKKYYSTEKIQTKINLNELAKCLKYLKLQKSVSYDDKKKSKFYYIGKKSNTIPYETNFYNNGVLTKETREQFSVEKNRTKKFDNLIEDDNILLNYHPIVKNKIDTFTINSNQIEYNINKEKEKEKNKEKKSSVEEIEIILNKNNNPSNIDLDNNINNINIISNGQKEEISNESKINNNNINAKQIIKLEENLKKKIENETHKKNDKFKISVKVKRLALGLEKNNNKEKNKDNEIKSNDEIFKLKGGIPIIYTKKRTQIVCEDK